MTEHYKILLQHMYHNTIIFNIILMDYLYINNILQTVIFYKIQFHYQKFNIKTIQNNIKF